jgi:hypothetical protein
MREAASIGGSAPGGNVMPVPEVERLFEKLEDRYEHTSFPIGRA